CLKGTIGGPGWPRFFRTFAHGEGDEEIVWATIPFDPLATARENFRVKEMGNWALIAKEYQQIGKDVSNAVSDTNRHHGE
ncbi:hypothetical protein ACFLV0_06600, partial [Chloroflexota bacterium]